MEPLSPNFSASELGALKPFGTLKIKDILHTTPSIFEAFVKLSSYKTIASLKQTNSFCDDEQL